ncbi:MAG TPA: cysteine hydrolase [Stellaceae bacterium]|jgi:nicotinamidase-related amidase
MEMTRRSLVTSVAAGTATAAIAPSDDGRAEEAPSAAGAAAVLAIHYQNEVLDPGGKIKLGVAEDSPRRATVIAAARRMLDDARASKTPIIHVRIAFSADYHEVVATGEMWRRVVSGGVMKEGSWGAEFYPDLGPQPSDVVITHACNNAFLFSPLEAVLRKIGVGRLTVAGIATNLSVESTVRHASDVGYAVRVVADACSARDDETHHASLRTMANFAEIA